MQAIQSVYLGTRSCRTISYRQMSDDWISWQYWPIVRLIPLVHVGGNLLLLVYWLSLSTDILSDSHSKQVRTRFWYPVVDIFCNINCGIATTTRMELPFRITPATTPFSAGQRFPPKPEIRKRNMECQICIINLGFQPRKQFLGVSCTHIK